MFNFLLFDVAKLLCNNHITKKKHFARLAKEDHNLIILPSFAVNYHDTSVTVAYALTREYNDAFTI